MFKWLSVLTETISSAPAVETPASALVTLPLFTKGLLVTLMGLLGVFLVLTLFFATIKLMQKLGTQK